MKKIIVISGFLGAGKTTLIVNLARILSAEGRKVALITNDRGSVLVDTEFMKATGLPVYSVSGGCFCTHIDLLEGVLREIGDNPPDVVIAEPIGSCIDLLATILAPINSDFTETFDLSPLTTVVDPARLGKYLARKGSGGETHLDYVFFKQMEQADVLFLNKTDLLPPGEADRLAGTLADLFPGKKVLTGSALGEACARPLLDELLDAHWEAWSVDIDKGRHGAAERALSWYSVAYRAKGAASARDLLQDIGGAIARRFPGRDIAHLKLVATAEDCALKVSFTGGAGHADGEDFAGDFLLILNARLEATTAEISGAVFSCAEAAARRRRVQLRRATAGR